MTSLKKEEMTAIVNEDLGHIPRGKDFDTQSQLRLYFNVFRREDLKLGKNKEETLLRCLEAVSERNPSAKPVFDTEYFAVQKKF